MKRLWILPVVLLVACGRPQGHVQFVGSSPLRPQDPDDRRAAAFCGKCGKAADFGSAKCSNGQCGARLTWADSYPCPSCGATGECRACRTFDQKDQKCFNCRGEGFLTLQGKTAPCPHCGGSKTCPMCKANPGKCDQCGGSKKLTRDQVTALAKKTATKKGDEAP